MSKNIVIQEGGTGKQFTADKLKTNLVGGGTCLWVPEDETTLGTKNINENGTYNASDDGYYGYSAVTVNGVGTATGTGPDGETHSYTEDGQGGITDIILPDHIAIVTPPTVTTYADGATIDFSGMVAKAYLKAGGLWTDSTHPNGVIPISELIFPVTTADISSAEKDIWSDGDGINAMLISYTEHWNLGYDYIHNRPDPSKDRAVYISQTIGSHNSSMFGITPAMWGGNGPTQFYATIYNDKLYIWGATARRALNSYEDSGREYNKYNMWSGTSADTGSGELVTFSSVPSWITGLPTSTKAPTGNEELQPEAAKQTIPVQWTRPGDYSTLESTFDITVTARETQATT